MRPTIASALLGALLVLAGAIAAPGPLQAASGSHVPGLKPAARVLPASLSATPVALDLAVDREAATVGETVTITVWIRPGPDKGTIEVTADGTVIARRPADGDERYTVRRPVGGPGKVAFGARYRDAARRTVATAATHRVTVRRIATELALSLEDRRPAAREPVTLRARVSPRNSTGKVVFLQDGREFATAPVVDGVATARWRARHGETTLDAIYRGDARHSQAGAEAISVTPRTRPAHLVAERDREIRRTFEAEAMRATRARLRHSGWLRREARGRLRARAEEEDAKSPAYTPLSYKSTYTSERQRNHLEGKVFGGGAVGHGVRRYVHGDLDLADTEALGTSLEFNASVSWESDFGGNALGGIYFGSEMGRVTVANAFDGKIDTFGVNGGAYAARHLTGSVIVDGWISAARLFHDTSLDDDAISLAGDLTSTALTFGGVVTGERTFDHLVLIPEVSLAHSIMWIDGVGLRAVTADAASTVAVDGSVARLSRAEFVPRMTRFLDIDQRRSISLAPHAACELSSGVVETSGCGLGMGMGYDVRFGNERGSFAANVEVESIDGEARRTLGLTFTLTF